ncbi:MAG: hypothetical protein JO272_01130 [Pseudonocardiales bacterium]|nr:hypothetical protein [Pseudonocardiales bacterium]
MVELRAPVTTSPQLYAAALHGHTPAEALVPADQQRLLTELWARGWTDVQIATHTRWTSYVVGRIRERLGLAPNGVHGEEGGVA